MAAAIPALLAAIPTAAAAAAPVAAAAAPTALQAAAGLGTALGAAGAVTPLAAAAAPAAIGATGLGTAASLVAPFAGGGFLQAPAAPSIFAPTQTAAAVGLGQNIPVPAAGGFTSETLAPNLAAFNAAEAPPSAISNFLGGADQFFQSQFGQFLLRGAGPALGAAFQPESTTQVIPAGGASRAAPANPVIPALLNLGR